MALYKCVYYYYYYYHYSDIQQYIAASLRGIDIVQKHSFSKRSRSRLRALYAVAGPSIVRLSSVYVRAPYSAVEIFSNISSPFGTLAIC